MQNKKLMLFASLSHVTGALLALVYNLIIRAGIQPGLSETVTWASKIYVVVATSLSFMLGWVLFKRLQGSVANPHGLGGHKAKILMFPLVRALISSMAWLGCIPVLTAVAIHVNGQVDPVGFPHFLASILLAWLVSTTYSSIFNTCLALNVARDTIRKGQTALHAEVSVPGTKILQKFLRAVPLMALAIPLLAGTMYLLVFRRWQFPAQAAKSLEYFLVALTTIGSYGWIYCRLAVTRMMNDLHDEWTV